MHLDEAKMDLFDIVGVVFAVTALFKVIVF